MDDLLNHYRNQLVAITEEIDRWEVPKNPDVMNIELAVSLMKAFRESAAYISTIKKLKANLSTMTSAYRESDEEFRQQARQLFADFGQIVGWAPDVIYLLIDESVENRSIQGVEDCIALIAMLDASLGPRQAVLALETAFREAARVGLDPKLAFKEIAKIASSTHPNGDTPMQELILEIPERFGGENSTDNITDR